MNFREFIERIEDPQHSRLPYAYQPKPDQVQFYHDAQQEAQLRQNIKEKLAKAIREPQNAYTYISQLVDPNTGELSKIQNKKNIGKYLMAWLQYFKSGEEFPGQLAQILKTALSMT